MNHPNAIAARSFLRTLLVVLALPAVAQAQGIALNGAGPINRSMSGAATAAPIDAAGALLWNPATLSGLRRSQIEIGMELILPTERISSSVQPGALGGGFPPIELAGSTQGEPGVSPIPTLAWAHTNPNSRWAYGIGIFGIAGFRVNYPASATNPILTPPPPNGIGMGRIVSQAEYYQIAPTVSYKLTESFSVGFAPTITLANIMADPLVLAAPNDANMDGFASYPRGNGSRYAWGGGFQIGAYYESPACWQLGFSVKSPQWSEPIRFHTMDEVGSPLIESVRFDYPMILSLGWAYTGFERWVLACDVRYFDYENAAGFGDDAGFDAAGRVTGLGWKSIFSVHTGAQFRATRRLSLRMGYQFAENPIGSNAAFFNVASPLSIQHVVSTGMSYQLTRNALVSLAYLHGFEGRSSGPMHAPGLGPIPGTWVTNSTSADAIAAGVAVQY